jgi:flagellar protein FliO/FliZ
LAAAAIHHVIQRNAFRPMSSFRSPSFALLLLACLTPCSGFAAETPALVPASSLGGGLFQLIFGLATVLALLLGGLWLLKKLVLRHHAHPGLLRVIAATAVGGRERVVILEVGGTWLVLGVAPGRVSALAELPRQPLPASAPGDERSTPPSWLRRLFHPR